MTRRAQGEGGLFKRADGRWDAVLDRGYVDGRRQRIKRTRRTKREAAEALAELRDATRHGQDVAGSRLTVGQWLTRWLADEARTSVRPRTYLMYETNVRLHIAPALGQIPLRSLSPAEVKRFTTQQSNSYSAQTVRNQHGTLRRALEIAVRYQLVERNVARLVEAPRVRREEVHPLSADETRRMLAATAGRPLEALFALAAQTGMRLGEVLGLTWEHVHLDAGYVRVERQLARYAGEWHLDAPKTRQSRRTVTLAAGAVDVLRHHHDRQLLAQRGEAWSYFGNEWGLVFTDDAGRPLHGRAVRDELHAILDAASVRRVRFHDLRHGAATFLLAEGVPMRVVQDVLGHAQLSMTADLYSHVVPELREDAARRIGAVLFGS